MVLQGVLKEVQLLVSFPCNPFTYHVLANVGTVAVERPSSRIMHVIFIFLSLSENVRGIVADSASFPEQNRHTISNFEIAQRSWYLVHPTASWPEG
jgi:hypothetical protein